MLPGVDRHPHAQAVLTPALTRPSHAYLFHGPAGSGKADVARAFAAALLSEGAKDPDNVRARVAHGVHPDLTWVAPSGAHEMLRADVDEPVVAAAAHTPFEASRRVFVLERAEAMNDEAANRLLKTLEEPPSYVVLVLLTDRLSDVLPTIQSRCQLVRFDPLDIDAITERIKDAAAARLCLGDLRKAALLAAPEGKALRDQAEAFARATMNREAATSKAWAPILSGAGAQGAAAKQTVMAAWEQEKELLPMKERRKREREIEQRAARSERRARTTALDHGLELVALWFRDLGALAAGAPDVVCAVDRLDELREDVQDRPFATLRQAVELVEDTRMRLVLNVSEDLALEALTFRLEALLG